MSMTLYFAKLNLVSDNIFELYDNPNQRNAISRALYEAINANKIWEKENLFIDANGEQRSTITEYSTHILRVDDTYSYIETSVYKGYKRDKIEMRGDRAEMSDFPLYLNTVAGGLDCRDQTIGGFSFVVKIYAVPVVEIIG